MSTDNVYARQQFGQTIGFGKFPALLIVDFQNHFTDPDALGGGNILDAVNATVPLLAFFRDRHLPVAFTRIVYAGDGSNAGVWCQKVPRLRDLTETSDASQVVGTLIPRRGELIVRKTQASAFFGTELSSVFITKSVDTIVVAGCTTSGCVRASVVDTMSWGFRAIVATDCVGDRALGPHEASLFDMGQKYADLLDSNQIMATLVAQ